jgi:hypothetical protein
LKSGQIAANQSAIAVDSAVCDAIEALGNVRGVRDTAQTTTQSEGLYEQ